MLVQKHVKWCGSKINEKTGNPKWMIMGVDNTWYSSFDPDVGKAVEKIKAGDTVEMEIKSVMLKGGGVINELMSVRPLESNPQEPTPNAPSGPVPTPGQSVVNENLLRQALIVSQSSLDHAVATMARFPVEPGDTVDLCVERIKIITKEYAEYVWTLSHVILNQVNDGTIRERANEIFS